jgi:hypothetical protein
VVKLGREFVAIGAAISLAGCDLGGTYGKRYSESLTSVGQRAAAAAMLCDAETQVTDAATKPSGVMLRLPSLFKEHAASLAASEPRAQPPFLKIPGFSYTIERLVDDPADPKKFAAVHCYLAAVPKADQQADALQADVQTQVAAALPGAAWQDVQLGGGISGKLLSVTGPQEFHTADASGATAPATIDGRLDLYFCESDSHLVLVGFRAPTAHAGKYQFFDAVKISLETLKKAG